MSLYIGSELEKPANSVPTLVSWHCKLDVFVVGYKLSVGGTFHVYKSNVSSL